MSTPGGEVIGEAQVTVDMDLDPAQQALQQLSRDVNGRLRDVQGRFVSAGDGISGSLQQASGSGNEFSLSLGRLGEAAGSAGSSLARVGASLGVLGAQAGAALPLLAGAVTAVQNIAPAGAVAVTGLLAVKQATAAVKLGMVGVEEAVQAALDPSDPKAFEEALKRLSPEAQKFAKAVQTLQPQLKELQQGVQNELFLELGSVLEGVASSVLPVFQENLLTTANILGTMAAETAFAAKELAEDGTLGKAMEGANAGLSNLASLPSQVVTALGQLAAAGATHFDRLTESAAGAATEIFDRLSAAFESGALEESVDTAIGLLKDLGGILANVFGTVKNVLDAAGAAGGGAFTILTEITQTLQDVSATEGFQEAIGVLVETMSLLARTAGPLLVSALSVVGPVLLALAGPVQTLISALGDALQPIIDALGPVLVSLAGAVGSLVEAFAPLLPVVGELVASLLPPLVPIIDLLAQTFDDLAPLVEQVGDLLKSTLAPAIDELPSVIDPLLDVFAEMTTTLLPVLSDLLVELAPSLAELARASGQLLVALVPLIEVLGPLLADALAGLIPALTPVIDLFVRFATVAVEDIAGNITRVIVPAVRALTELIRGDFSAAWTSLEELVTGVWTQITEGISRAGTLIKQAIDVIIGIFQFLYDTLVGGSIVPDLVNAIIALFTFLGAFLGRITRAARDVIVNTWNVIRTSVTAIVTGIRDAVATAFNAVFRIASSTFGSVRSTISGSLTSSARAVSNGVSTIRRVFSDGFRAVQRSVSESMDSVVETLRGIPDEALNALGNLGSLLYSSGRSLIRGFIDGIQSMTSLVNDSVSSILGGARNFFPFSPAEVGPFSGKGWTRYSGEALVGDFARGITLARPEALSATGDLASMTAQALSASPLPVVSGPVIQERLATVSAPRVNVTLVNQGVIGSRIETLAWLTQALEQLRREGRLPLPAGSAGVR